MDLQQQKTISCSQKDEAIPSPLPWPKGAVRSSRKPEMVGTQYGWLKIISPVKLWSKTWNHSWVLVQCTGCGTVKWIDLHNLQSGQSKGCQHCSQKRKIPLWLDRRLTAAKQRCENPNDRNYANYGGRGIKFCFSSVTEAGLYLMAVYGIPDRCLEIDRINTNGNYEPGNIRFVTRAANLGNRRKTVLSEFWQGYWPYARNVVTRKLSQGLSREEIIQDAKKAVAEK